MPFLSYIAEIFVRDRNVQLPALDINNTIEMILVHGNWGRWVIECECGYSILASEQSAHFICSNPDCANGERWRAIVWPGEREDIESRLRVRPIRNQNWIISDTLSVLERENTDHNLVKSDGLDST